MPSIETRDQKDTQLRSISTKTKILAYILYLFLGLTFIYTFFYILIPSPTLTKPLITNERISSSQKILGGAKPYEQVINVANTQIITDDNQFDYIFDISNNTPKQFSGKIIITLLSGNISLKQQTFDYTKKPIPAYQSRIFITISYIPPKNYSFYPVIDTYKYAIERKNHQLISSSGDISQKIVQIKISDSQKILHATCSIFQLLRIDAISRCN